ncbi:MAG: ABC transporter permease subunit [Bacteroidales bacterium]|nr:ABC transporter permease subunit [Bacteroidales bacterium]
MIRLLKIEYKKIRGSRVFWILTGLYALLIIVFFFGIQGVIDDLAQEANKKSPIPLPGMSAYSMPEIWHNLTYVAGYFKIFLGVVIIILITNEYSYKTIRQNVITGFSRWDFISSKFLTIGVLSLAATILVFIIGMILGLMYTEGITAGKVFGKTEFLLAYFLEIYAFLMMCLFVGILVKRSGFAIGLLLLYYYIVEPIARYKLPDTVGDFFPKKAIGTLIDIPNTSIMRLFGVEFQDYISPWDALLVIAYVMLFGYFSYLILKKRDL